MISSRVIAEQLGKRHSDVLEALAKILETSNEKYEQIVIPTEIMEQ